MNHKTLFISVFLWAAIAASSHANQLKGIVQVYLSQANDLASYQNQGTGILRYDENKLGVQQALLSGDLDLSSSLSLNVVANYYQDGEQNLGFTQAQLIYKPLSNDTVRFKGRAGFFYPRVSLENVDDGWLSPFTYTQSAINSWIGEELRTAGVEFSLYSPGRARNSPWSWELIAAGYKANDPLGTLISWRGFAMHDRQSLHNDKIRFAPYPTVIDREIIWHPSYVEPFHELDGDLGVYIGVHANYFNRTTFRYYYFDNLTDPIEINEQRLYGWRTKFHSMSFQHKFTPKTRVISQWMSGSTLMGERFVFVDFNAWYVMLSHKINQHRFSARFDRFIVQEDDAIPVDQNDSDGMGLTFAWRYDLDNRWQLGFEQHFNRNSAQNRATLGLPVDTNQQQSLFVVQFRW